MNRRKPHPYLNILCFVVIFAVITMAAGMVTYYPATVGLIGVNAIVFLMVKTRKCHVMNLGMASDYVEHDREYYRIVTSAFTHEDPMHILCNMVSMYNIGSVLEYSFGTERFIISYIIVLIFGGFLSYLIHKKFSPRTVCIGASGTICGLLGIYAVLAFRIYGLAGVRSVIPTIGILLVMTFSKKIDSIGHFAGLLVGMAYGFLL